MKSRIKLSLVSIIALMFLASANIFAQKSVELKYNIEKGDSYKITNNIDMDMSFDANGSTMTMESVMDIETTTTVVSLENDEISQEMAFDRIAMNQKIMGMEINYDSGDSTTFSSGLGAQVGAEMNKIIGKSINMVLDKYGNILSIDVAAISSTDVANNVTSGNTFAVYPDHKIKVGESWESDIKPLKDSEMKTHIKYTLLKTSRKQSTIGVEGIISANEIEGKEIRMEGTTSGEMVVNTKTGMLISSIIDLEMEMDIEQGGTTFPASLMSTSKTNVNKIN